MAVNDPIGDMIARIRNAQMRNKSKVSMPGSKQRERVLRSAQDRRLSSAATPAWRMPTAATSSRSS